MSIPSYRRSRFDITDEDPMGPLANMADIMLVFAVGLMVALAASERADNPMESGVDVEAGREMPELPEGAGETGEGYQPMGQVYRDPETGRMIMIDKGKGQ
ncbi:hypothetical protein DES49_0524 [Halospina denitrificans]|uniref:DUF2149 domain-containing protein n=1 Tax=Halospina denitrificans TaxID=332522 RepID=A0A4R7K0Q6_9GAMM|nr:DUF2149 domain-containing protein [Halospina denitrificans]TDT44422.1 hypothetical protein DES49_0524 [Halospina denitrificans]